MDLTRPGIAMSAEDDDIVEGYGIHGCCCEHVVEELDAAPAADLAERHMAARDRYFECPHKWLTPLEVYLGTLR